MAWSFAKPDISGESSSRNTRSLKKRSNLTGNLSPQVCPSVLHGQQNTSDTEVSVENPPNAVEGCHQLCDAFKREILACQGNEDLIGCDECVHCEKSERGWRVDKYVVKLTACLFQERPQF